MIACAVGPVYGGSPPNISYSTEARLYWSLRPSSLGSALACSGLMYAGVPRESPVSVSRSHPAMLTASAIPKSATIGSPWWSIMFSGLMSVWMKTRDRFGPRIFPGARRVPLLQQARGHQASPGLDIGGGLRVMGGGGEVWRLGGFSMW